LQEANQLLQKKLNDKNNNSNTPGSQEDSSSSSGNVVNEEQKQRKATLQFGSVNNLDPDCQVGWDMDKGHDLHGHGQTVVSQPDCFALCKTDESCGGYSFIEYSSSLRSGYANCFLKKKEASFQPYVKPDIVDKIVSCKMNM